MRLTQRIARGTNNAMQARIPAPALVRRMALLAALAAAPLIAGCGLLDELPPIPTPTPSAANLLQNPGFENGADPWFALQQDTWRPFEISDSVARTGEHSLGLDLQGEDDAIATRIVGAIQPISATVFPEYVSGFYRVDDWQPQATFQYLQFVIVVRGGDFGDDFGIHEMRFPIAGIDREPFLLSNARFLFLSREAPKLRKWVYFGYPVRQAFATRLGRVPERWDSIEAFFEVRYDGKTAEQPATSARVYFDDLYAGPLLDNPNHPDGDTSPD